MHVLPRAGSEVPADDSALIVHRFGGETDDLVRIVKCAAPDVVSSPSTGLKTSRRATASLFSARSLAPLAERHGLHLHSFSPTTHWFYNVMPAWAVVQREKTRPRVGVVWSGNPHRRLDRFRNLPFSAIADLGLERGLPESDRRTR